MAKSMRRKTTKKSRGSRKMKGGWLSFTSAKNDVANGNSNKDTKQPPEVPPKVPSEVPSEVPPAAEAVPPAAVPPAVPPKKTILERLKRFIGAKGGKRRTNKRKNRK